jgi:Fe-S cluster assembly protein SufB
MTDTSTVEQVQALERYKYGFVTDIESETAPKGLSEDTIRFISAKKEEPEWLLDWRLRAYRAWTEMEEPDRAPEPRSGRSRDPQDL